MKTESFSYPHKLKRAKDLSMFPYFENIIMLCILKEVNISHLCNEKSRDNPLPTHIQKISRQFMTTGLDRIYIVLVLIL